ncbi:MAG: hypothetical protein RIR48_3587 [Bacteroidota bacterium]
MIQDSFRKIIDIYFVPLWEGLLREFKPMIIEKFKNKADVVITQSIPKLIHLTWKSKDIPAKYYKNYLSIVKTHPDWEIIIWTDEEMDSYIKEHGKEYYAFYKSFPYMIQKCDFFRVFIVYCMGGVYLDLDVTMEKSLNALLSKTQIFFPCEKILSDRLLHEYGDRDAVRIGNYAFGSTLKHPFMLYFINKIVETSKVYKTEENFGRNIINTTGPGLLTVCYHDYIKEKPETKITILYPSVFTLPSCGCGTYKFVTSCRVGLYGIHHHYATWW